MKTVRKPSGRKSRMVWSGGVPRDMWDYRQLKAGPDMPIPEDRPEILEKIQARLDKDGSFLQQYSNGEFTSSSLAISRTFDGCRGVHVLECPGYTIHFDAAQNLWWRRGGCFD